MAGWSNARQCAALDLELRRGQGVVQLRADQLQCDRPFHFSDLVGQVHDAHAAFAEHAPHDVVGDARAARRRFRAAFGVGVAQRAESRRGAIVLVRSHDHLGDNAAIVRQAGQGVDLSCIHGR
jgi:hypothetical protein